jgi:Na+-driven multidrug efflux pump
LRTVGLTYPFLALGIALYFACQGSGQVLRQVLARTVQLIVVIGGGFVLLATGTDLGAIFSLIAVGMVIFGTLSGLAVARTDWARR